MKKLVILMMMVCMVFTGCQKKQECDWCGEKKVCEEVKEGDDLITVICKDCMEELKEDFL